MSHTLFIPPVMVIDKACHLASTEANRRREDVEFEFNGVVVVAKPGETWLQVCDRFYEQNRKAREVAAQQIKDRIRDAIAAALPVGSNLNTVDRVYTAIKPFLSTPP